ncbi:MAG: Uncharacterised protein [Euryarchaeota archaeon UBA443]|nr:MAG: Uncharacterised protein [Euryarchaeota archaeon UBA443]
MIWKPNASAPLWHLSKGENHTSYFEDLQLKHLRQIGPSCVATTLCMVARATGADVTPEYFKARTNSQSPYSWSEALKPFGMQLAYCNHDQRRIGYIIDELKQLNDLFFVSFYSVDPPSDPDENGKLCTAHIITMHNSTFYDTAKSADNGGVCNTSDYSRLERQAKRIFRVVPVGHPRCL